MAGGYYHTGDIGRPGRRRLHHLRRAHRRRVQGLRLPDLAVRAGERADRARGGGRGRGGAVAGPGCGWRCRRRTWCSPTAGRPTRRRPRRSSRTPRAPAAVRADPPPGVRRAAQDDLRQDPPGRAARRRAGEARRADRPRRRANSPASLAPVLRRRLLYVCVVVVLLGQHGVRHGQHRRAAVADHRRAGLRRHRQGPLPSSTACATTRSTRRWASWSWRSGWPSTTPRPDPAYTGNQTALGRHLLYETGNNPFRLLLLARAADHPADAAVRAGGARFRPRPGRSVAVV